MFFLLATILTNTIIYLVFKSFTKFGVNSPNAVVFNYWTCVVTGSLYYGSFPVSTYSASEPWFGWAVANGFIFIALFNLMSYCTRKFGVTITTVANKLSLVIPVLFSFLLYNEEASMLKIAGIMLAIPAIYYSSYTKEENKSKAFFFPLLLFIGSGLLDTLLKYIEQLHLNSADVTSAFTIHLFLFAALSGTILMVISSMRSGKMFNMRDVTAGIVLGIPNYFSIYFFIRFLNSGVFESSVAIPVNNIGIVVASSLVAILFLKESATRQRLVGLALAIISILLIALSDGRSIQL